MHLNYDFACANAPRRFAQEARKIAGRRHRKARKRNYQVEKSEVRNEDAAGKTCQKNYEDTAREKTKR